MHTKLITPISKDMRGICGVRKSILPVLKALMEDGVYVVREYIAREIEGVGGVVVRMGGYRTSGSKVSIRGGCECQGGDCLDDARSSVCVV